MPSAAARRMYEDQIPSFMSVFDLDAETMNDHDTVTVVNPQNIGLGSEYGAKLATTSTQHLQPSMLPSDHSHRHHDSTSTQTTESAESSPTTTASCTDSSSLSDPSPSSSPDSPMNLVPLSQLAGPTFGGMPSMATLTVSEENLERPMTSPSPRRARNMKGLSIQPPFATTLNSSLVSEPSSPSFIKPKIPAMKRKPSQLSLKTSSNHLSKSTILEVPQSPSMPPILQRRALKHSTSSPHMLAGLRSSSFGPAGGMTFPTVLERNETGLSEFLRPSKASYKPSPSGSNDMILEEESPIKSQVANRAAFEFEPYHEQENNEDQKSPGYPDGPIAIYGDNVYLYLEPTAQEAAKFDVVINVAREVQNPFKATMSAAQTSPNRVGNTGQVNSPIPDTAVTDASFATAFEYPPEETTPTTPKAHGCFKEPEYVHVPWDHNTDIGSDLMSLCEMIDTRTKEGKRVLVHCQQGASRSASLIIAYGMYQNPDLTVNDSYHAAQAKSRWISPNMRLMYCLQDFQKEVAKRKNGPGSGHRPRSGRSPTKHRLTLSASDAMELSPKEPRTAPLLAEGDNPAADLERKPLRARGNSTPGSGEAVSPGPSSAPSSFLWAEKKDASDSQKFGGFNLNLHPADAAQSSAGQLPFDSTGPAPRPPPTPGFGSGFPSGFGSLRGTLHSASSKMPEKLSLAEIVQEPQRTEPATFGYKEDRPAEDTIMSPRVETMTKNPLHGPPLKVAGMAFIETPPTPSAGLFSPRETMFPRHPFFPFGRPPQVADPRSPPTKGETPIVRSIDEVL